MTPGFHLLQVEIHSLESQIYAIAEQLTLIVVLYYGFKHHVQCIVSLFKEFNHHIKL